MGQHGSATVVINDNANSSFNVKKVKCADGQDCSNSEDNYEYTDLMSVDNSGNVNVKNNVNVGGNIDVTKHEWEPFD